MVVLGDVDDEEDVEDIDESGFRIWQTSLCFSTDEIKRCGRLARVPSDAGDLRPG